MVTIYTDHNFFLKIKTKELILMLIIQEQVKFFQCSVMLLVHRKGMILNQGFSLGASASDCPMNFGDYIYIF